MEMTMSDYTMAYADFTMTCFGCGRKVKVRGGQVRWHGCRLRLLSRSRWASYLEGWHAAHRFDVENPDDPMVLADAEDYGTGWASYMRQGRDEGSVRVVVGEEPS
jgi:hypothetical protein